MHPRFFRFIDDVTFFFTSVNAAQIFISLVLLTILGFNWKKFVPHLRFLIFLEEKL